MKEDFLKTSLSENINEGIEKYWPQLESFGFYRRADGRIACPGRVNSETTWIYAGQLSNRFCDLWHRVFFHMFHIIPSNCHECWKVVARPKTLTELFHLAHLQKQLKHPGKCGIEARDYVHGLYGAYFYCDSLGQGKEVHGKVARMMREQIDSDIPIILKRGCTEFEMAGGPSTEWEISEKQIQIEEKLNEIFIKVDKDNSQSEEEILVIHKKWLQWAYAHGDPTFKDFTAGNDLYQEVITYHKES